MTVGSGGTESSIYKEMNSTRNSETELTAYYSPQYYLQLKNSPHNQAVHQKPQRLLPTDTLTGSYLVNLLIQPRE